jgi:hypothetical protein
VHVTAIPPPPRRIRRVRNRFARAFAIVCYAFTAAATLAAGLALANEIAWRFIGHDLTAALTSLHERPNSDGGYNRVAHYSYSPGPGHAPRSDSARLEHAHFRNLQQPFMKTTIPDDITFPPDRPGALPVRAYTLGPIAYGRPVQHEYHDFFMLIPLLALLLGVPIWIVLHRGVVERERGRKYLYKNGVAVLGTITARREEHTDESTYTLADYAYAAGDGPHAGTIWVRTTADWEHAQPGQTVTVLYDPKDPGHSTIYEYGMFRAA